jgi:hypothetical protein
MNPELGPVVAASPERRLSYLLGRSNRIEYKKALNIFEVPNYSGKTGNWKINQVWELMK